MQQLLYVAIAGNLAVFCGVYGIVGFKLVLGYGQGREQFKNRPLQYDEPIFRCLVGLGLFIEIDVLVCPEGFKIDKIVITGPGIQLRRNILFSSRSITRATISEV